MYYYGIRGNVLAWLELLLKDRTHQTRVGESLSSSATLTSDVIQSSGIGPIAFRIYVDNLARLLDSYGIVVKLFADNVKVYLRITK